MRIIIGCECTGTVRDEFAARGHDAWSCDLLPSAAPGQHIHGNVLDHLDDGWDAMIVHPDCTYLTSSAEWAYGDGPYHMKLKPGTLVGQARWQARWQAISFVKELAASGIPQIAIENPRGALSSKWRKPDQTIQPYQFGDDASKATCLWLVGLPKLVIEPACRRAGRWVVNPANGKLVERWGNQTASGQNNLTPTEDRWLKRATTYKGIARAMAEQWGSAILPPPAPVAADMIGGGK